MATADRSRRSLRIGLLTTATWFLLDQQTKHLALNLLLPPGRKVEMPGPFTWQLTFNQGGAFGLSMPRWFFLAVTVVVAVWVLRELPRLASDVRAVAFGLLLAGALGNASDRVLRDGHRVVDFIASALWPTFNVADIAITFGFVTLVGQLLREESDGAPEEQP